MSKQVAGVLPIAHTPFLENDDIDYASLERQTEWALQQGAQGFCTGMVSELLRLTVSERLELTRQLAQLGRGAVVVAGVGAESTRQAMEYAREAEQAGCTATMAIPPLSTALPADEVYSYYAAIARSVSLPLIVQDASGYVGQAIPLSVYVRLLDDFGPQKILFKPEAAPIGPNLTALRQASGGRAQVLEGSGGILLIDSYRRGIAGTMPGMEFLDGIVALWRALQDGNDAVAYRIYFPICALVALQMQAGLDGFLAIEKYLLHRRGLFATDRRRSPHAWSLDEETRREVDRLMALLQETLATV